MTKETIQLNKTKHEFSFSTLGFFVKLFLVGLCVLSLILASGMVFIVLKKGSVHPFALVLAVLGLCSYAFWHLWAVSKRKVNQITTLAILNLLIGGNIAGCVIMFFIRQSAVKERALINKEKL
ncbi:hypothetical protein ATS72_007475 [Pseudoalteromonas sp. 13-15]|jgi:hypothetical protein|uniref:hypothetical protein n=1 Tax=Pseudoalteromonas TaxID=53246 RepID=UPI00057B5F96|nr:MULTISPECIES: hypothetical protein [Pseudoalteromonas]ATG57482.1 hypothetical protein CPA52_04130 [Pseudoalteromonas marina]AUL73437.1 hypothetical protein ATS72_007475 [Pseudoalteromonas sp. 13-15]MCK8121255.1 hypothetical protein [Pseudoalteromonas sp. 2CM32C]SIN88029.1 hypothetical protein SAMN05878071_1501 [Pseudoalteromonas marina]BBW90668.1 hypothetical protein PS1M3_07550 [Pseudoalteromonas sp. PS1M3]